MKLFILTRVKFVLELLKALSFANFFLYCVLLTCLQILIQLLYLLYL
jgi:hypothetical protein